MFDVTHIEAVGRRLVTSLRAAGRLRCFDSLTPSPFTSISIHRFPIFRAALSRLLPHGARVITVPFSLIGGAAFSALRPDGLRSSFVGQLSPTSAMRRTRAMHPSPALIFLIGDGLKMRRITARSNATKMIYLETVGHFFHKGGISGAMYTGATSVALPIPISLRRKSALPDPTRRRMATILKANALDYPLANFSVSLPARHGLWHQRERTGASRWGQQGWRPTHTTGKCDVRFDG